MAATGGLYVACNPNDQPGNWTELKTQSQMLRRGAFALSAGSAQHRTWTETHHCQTNPVKSVKEVREKMTSNKFPVSHQIRIFQEDNLLEKKQVTFGKHLLVFSLIEIKSLENEVS